MSSSLLDHSLGSIACDIPGATRVFHQHRLDFCCNGGKSLRDAAAQKGIDANAITTELQALTDCPGLGRDWREASSSELIDHILSRFHDRHRVQLPELVRLARRVEHVHGSRPECPNGLADHLDAMQQELESHMLKEEQILFPMLRQDMHAGVSGPISIMRFEHDHHGEALETINKFTNDITPPGNACNTWRALYRGLSELREDLMQHIHLENNVLFARIQAEGEKVHG
ncbi:MAG: iron-sulfur cluster repair protein YtfE [Moraxellaceae bacterium]|nr:iron-sulfur cluster repair protein YtfE [Moraxellaceae bacterium]MBP8851705.1 iron-sulfur cluster repair protein YtfE [Moraxellaceae bacterium]MBP9044715.1 iron-sulfur cluster repair protein YtfE [Moraxellaceae bacterium]MBP9729807.1 iron-sulfur cluster repair protein YtfE [Moraxellaceae bacterium]MCC6199462.1 iron-sulfur cluster repair protein YtfE [Moraxellaceae bacterium]